MSNENTGISLSEISSFYVERCRKISEDHAEFDVRVISGKLSIGDRFDCVAETGNRVRFYVRKIEERNGRLNIQCEGFILYDDQFTRYTVVTSPYPPARPDLPMPRRTPRVANDEVAFMKKSAPDWDYLHPLQQAIVLSIFQRRKTQEELSEELMVSPNDIKSALRGMNNVLVADSLNGEIWLW